jgi:hypothetical protein
VRVKGSTTLAIRRYWTSRVLTLHTAALLTSGPQSVAVPPTLTADHCFPEALVDIVISVLSVQTRRPTTPQAHLPVRIVALVAAP